LSYRQFVYLLSLSAIASAPLNAQENPAPSTPSVLPPAPVITPDVPAEPEVTVDELVERALTNNPQLPIARQNQEAARQRLRSLRSLQNPTLELVPGIAGNEEARDEEVILAQPFDVFGQRRARSRVAVAELRRAQAETTLAERTMIVEVKNAAADLFASQEAEVLGQVQVEVAQLFRDAAARRAELGDVPPVQVQRADLELLRVQNELTNAQAERLARRAALNQLVGQPPETPLRVALHVSAGLTDVLRVRPSVQSTPTPSAPTLRPDAVPGAAPTAAGAGSTAGGVPSVPPSGAPPTAAPSAPVRLPPLSTPALGASVQVGSNLVGLRSQLLPGALTNRPDVVGAQATLEARRAQVGVLRRERLPNIELQARRSSFFGREGSYGLRAVVTMPVFDFGSIKGEQRAVEAEVRAQQATINLLRSQLAVQVEQALLRLQQQRQTVERYRTGIVPLTVDLLRKTQIGYAQGASTYLEVLEAQRTLRQVQTEYLQALVGTRTSEAALESALGAVPPSNVVGGIANPAAPATPSGLAAPGTVPEGTVPPNVVPPVNPPGAPSTNTVPTIPTTPGTPTMPQGGGPQ
jgi:outer membrane protein TolC